MLPDAPPDPKAPSAQALDFGNETATPSRGRGKEPRTKRKNGGNMSEKTRHKAGKGVSERALEELGELMSKSTS